MSKRWVATTVLATRFEPASADAKRPTTHQPGGARGCAVILAIPFNSQLLEERAPGVVAPGGQ